MLAVRRRLRQVWSVVQPTVAKMHMFLGCSLWDAQSVVAQLTFV